MHREIIFADSATFWGKGYFAADDTYYHLLMKSVVFLA